MIKTSPVRRPVPEDRPEILAMCREMHAEHGMFSMSDERINNLLDRAFHHQGGVIGVIGPRGGRLEASVYMLISSMWYSDDFHLEELWNFVRPDYRKVNNGGNVRELLSFAKRCGDELHIPVLIGIMSNVRTKAKVDLYTRLLGEPMGAFFLHKPEKVA